MKALLCCRACSPGRGSEPGLGWNFAFAVSSFCETHVIVANESRPQIEEYCAAHQQETSNLHFHFLDEHLTTGKCTEWFEKKLPTLYYYHNYRKWLRRAAALAEELDAREKFDIVHQLTLAGFRFPGYLWRLRKPLLWGPCGGLDNAPYRLLFSLRLVDVVGYMLRNLINTYQKHFGYAAVVYSRYADYILASTREGERVLKRIWKRPGEYMCEIGTKNSICDFTKLQEHIPGTPLRVCWVGVMNNQRKNLPLLFRALQFCKSPVEISVLGDGALREQWEKLSRRIPSRHRVVFLGSVPHEQVFAEMKRSHVFCITSVKDDTSSVLLEALQHGLPVIAPDSCGFAGVITPESGIKIDINWPGTFARLYGEALESLATNEPLRLRLSQGAATRAEEFAWTRKTLRLKEIYTALVSGQQP